MSQGRAARTARASAVAFTTDDVLYCSMPLFHGNALLANLLPGAWSRAPRWCCAGGSRRPRSCPTCGATAAPTSTTSAGPCRTCWPCPSRPRTHDNPLKWGLGSEASPRDLVGVPSPVRLLRRRGLRVERGRGGHPAGRRACRPSALGLPKEGLDVAVLDPATGEECPPADSAKAGAAERRVRPSARSSAATGCRRSRATTPTPRPTPSGPATGGTGPATSATATTTASSTSPVAPPTGCASTARTSRPARSSGSSVGSRAWPRSSCTPCPTRSPPTRSWPRSSWTRASTFDPIAFASFLAEQPDLGTKWAPRFVRLVDATPTHRHRQDRPQAPARRAVGTDDPVWWRPSPVGALPAADERRRGCAPPGVRRQRPRRALGAAR